MDDIALSFESFDWLIDDPLRPKWNAARRLTTRSIKTNMAHPRKFVEKIAIHNQRMAEETRAFEEIMKEVSVLGVGNLSVRKIRRENVKRKKVLYVELICFSFLSELYKG